MLALMPEWLPMQVRQAVYGAESGTLKDEGDDYDIVVRYDAANRKGLESLGKITLTTLMGTQVRLSDIADIKQGFGPMEIRRESQQRLVTVGAETQNIDLGDATEKAREIMKNTVLPSGVSCQARWPDKRSG